MSRTLTAAVITELGTDKLELAYLIELFMSSTTRITTHGRPLVDSGNTYVANGIIKGFGAAAEDPDLKVSSLQLSFSNENTTIAAIFLSENYIDRRVLIRGVLVDANDAVIANPITYRDGTITNFKIVERDGDSVSIVTIASHWDDFERINGRLTNSNSQRVHFPNDKFFDFASDVVKEIRWGRP